jgi:hypothetical protein
LSITPWLLFHRLLAKTPAHAGSQQGSQSSTNFSDVIVPLYASLSIIVYEKELREVENFEWRLAGKCLMPMIPMRSIPALVIIVDFHVNDMPALIETDV